MAMFGGFCLFVCWGLLFCFFGVLFVCFLGGRTCGLVFLVCVGGLFGLFGVWVCGFGVFGGVGGLLFFF